MKATYYELRKSEVYVGPSGYLRVAKFRPFQLGVPDPNEKEEYFDLHVQVLRAPGGASVAMVLSPELKEVMDAIYQAETYQLRRRLSEATSNLERVNRLNNRHINRIDSFNELPWYRRAWLAMKGPL